MTNYHSFYYTSPFGTLKIVSDNTHLHQLLFTSETVNQSSTPPSNLPAPILACCQQLDEYFARKRTVFDLPISWEKASLFQKALWQSLQTIPFGEIKTYRELAFEIRGNYLSARAIGNGCGQNPFHIIVPCHRVLRSDGTFGGYKAGITIKTKLLQLETIL